MTIEGRLRRTILVTGGAGFIGSALVRFLLDQDSSYVVNIDKLSYAANLASIPQASGHSHYAFERIDICDGPGLRRAFETYQPDGVINLAAETHVDRSIDTPADFIQTNIVGTFTLLQESLRYWRTLSPGKQRAFQFVHISTDEVFGSLGASEYSTEQTPYAPNSPYSGSKAASDHLVRAWHKTYGLPVITTHCCNTYGPYHFPEKLIPLMIIKGLAGEPLPVYGDGSHIRDWLFVDDHVHALTRILQDGVPGETYNIGGYNEYSNLAVVKMICDLLDRFSPIAGTCRQHTITFVPDRPGHDKRYAIDASKIERELGWIPRETFSTGLEKTVKWYLENRSWWQPILNRGYKTGRLGIGAVAAE